MGWEVEFFADAVGNAPVEQFLLRLPMQQRAKALAIIKLLEQEGPNLPFPYSSQVRGKLRELRMQQGNLRWEEVWKVLSGCGFSR